MLLGCQTLGSYDDFEARHDFADLEVKVEVGTVMYPADQLEYRVVGSGDGVVYFRGFVEPPMGAQGIALTMSVPRVVPPDDGQSYRLFAWFTRAQSVDEEWVFTGGGHWEDVLKRGADGVARGIVAGSTSQGSGPFEYLFTGSPPPSLNTHVRIRNVDAGASAPSFTVRVFEASTKRTIIQYLHLGSWTDPDVHLTVGGMTTTGRQYHVLFSAPGFVDCVEKGPLDETGLDAEFRLDATPATRRAAR